MFKKVQKIVLFIYFLSYFFLGTIYSKSIESNSLYLEIYDGHGSLLLSWDIHNNIKTKEIKIFRKSGRKGEFKLIKNYLGANGKKK